MSGRDLASYDDVVNYIEDFPGADIPRDLVKVALVAQDIDSLEFTASDGSEIIAKVVGADGNRIEEIPLGTPASGGDTALVTKVSDALQEVSNTQVRVDIENNNAGTLPVEQQSAIKVEDANGNVLNLVTPSDFPLGVNLETNNAGTLPVEQQTEVAIEDTTGAAIDPLASSDLPLGVDNDEGIRENLNEDNQFRASHRVSGIADASTAMEAVFQNPSGSGVTHYMTVQIITGGLAFLDISEDITIDSSGTAFDFMPADIQSGSTPTITAEYGGSYTVNGTTRNTIVPGSSGGNPNAITNGAASPVDAGVKLDPGDSVKFLVVNQSGNSNPFAINADVAEV